MPKILNLRATTLGVMLVFALIVTLLRYSGAADQYHLMLAYFNDPTIFGNDVYLSNSFYSDASIFFPLNKFLRLEQSDFRGLAMFFLLTFIGAVVVYWMVREYFNVHESVLAITVLLLLFFVANRFPVNVWGGIIPLKPSAPAMFAHPFGYLSIYLMMKRYTFAAALCVTLTIMFCVKAHFLLVPSFMLWILLDKKIPKSRLFFSLIPIIYVLFKAATSVNLPASFEDRMLLWELTILHDVRDSDFWFQGFLPMLMLGVSFLLFPLLVRQLPDPTTRSIAWAFYITSMLVVVCGLVYTGFLFKLFPYPPLMAVGLVRSLKFYLLFFYALSFIWILSFENFSPIEKVALVIALVLLHGESKTGYLVPIILVTTVFMTKRIFPTTTHWANRFGPAPMITGLLILMVIAQSIQGGKFHLTFDRLGLKYLNRFTNTLAANEATWKAYSSLAEVEKDMLLLAIYRPASGPVQFSHYLNIIARKTPFNSGGHHLYLNADLWRAHKDRNLIRNETVTALSEGREVPQNTVDRLANLAVTVMLPSDLAPLLSGWTHRREIDNFTMLIYGPS